MDILSTLVGFLIGVATGAAGSYFGTKYTEKRHKKENQEAQNKLYRQLEKDMPMLISEMKDDFLNPENKFVREFVLLKKSWTFNSSGGIFSYYFEDHPDLSGMILFLKENELIYDVTEKNIKKYRFDSEFVEYLRRK